MGGFTLDRGSGRFIIEFFALLGGLFFALFHRLAEIMDGAAEVTDGRVCLHFDAPEEAPTTRGFAGILHSGLDGTTVQEVLAVPADFSARLGLSDAVSPLRLRGIAAILGVVQRQVRSGGVPSRG